MNHEEITDNNKLMHELFSRMSVEKPSADFTSAVMTRIQEDTVHVPIIQNRSAARIIFYISALLFIVTLFFIPMISTLVNQLWNSLLTFDTSIFQNSTIRLIRYFTNLNIRSDILSISAACMFLFGLFFIIIYSDLLKNNKIA